MHGKTLGRPYHGSQLRDLPRRGPNIRTSGHQQRSFSNFVGLGSSSQAGRQSEDALESMLRTNPNFLIHQHNECKMDNKERLKNVSNLEDLVNFKVKTVADNLEEDTEKRMQAAMQNLSHQDGYPLEMLSAQQLASQASISVLKKMCDPLLANRHYPKLLAKKDTAAGKMTRDGQLMGMTASLRQQEKIEQKYEIPEELKRHPKNYNLLPAKVQALPKIGSSTQQEDAARASDRQESEAVVAEPTHPLEKSDSFLEQKNRFEAKQQELNKQSAFLKQEHARNLEEQEALLQQKLVENESDPVNLLKRYFENKHKEKKVIHAKDLKKNRKVPPRLSRSQMDHLPDESVIDPEQSQSFEKSVMPEKDSLLVGAVHANYIISKYQKMKKTGKLEKLDHEIERRSRLLDQQQLARAQEQMDGFMMGMYDSTGNLEADYDTGKARVSGLEKNKEFDEQYGPEQPQESKEQWEADGLDESSTMVGVKKMRDELKHIFKDEATDGYKRDMIDPIDEMQIHEGHQQANERQKQSSKYLQPLNQSHGGAGRVLVQQMLKQIHSELDTNQFDKMQVFQEDLKNMQKLTFQSQQKTWREDAHINEFDDEDDLKDRTMNRVGLHHSELTKYQSVKASAGQKDYINYTREQLEMAKNLKFLEAKHSFGKVTRATTSGGTNATIQTIKSRTIAAKKNMKSQGLARRRQLNLKDSVSDYKMGGVSLNLNGSLPQIKNQLERKKLSMPPIQSQKDFKEDQKSFDPYLAQMAGSQSIEGPHNVVNILSHATRSLAAQNAYRSQDQGISQHFGLPAQMSNVNELYTNQVIYGGKAIDAAFDQGGHPLDERKVDPLVEMVPVAHEDSGNIFNLRTEAQKDAAREGIARSEEASQGVAATGQMNLVPSGPPQPEALARELLHRASGENKPFSDKQNDPFDKSHAAAKYPYLDAPFMDPNVVDPQNLANRAASTNQSAGNVAPGDQLRAVKANMNEQSITVAQAFGQVGQSALPDNIASNSRKSRGSRVSIYSNQRNKTPNRSQLQNEQVIEQQTRQNVADGASDELRAALAQEDPQANETKQRQSRVVPFDVSQRAVSTTEKPMTDSDAVQTRGISEAKRMESVDGNNKQHNSKGNDVSNKYTGRTEAMVNVPLGGPANMNVISSTPEQEQPKAKRSNLAGNAQKSHVKYAGAGSATREERTPTDTEAQGSIGTAPERRRLQSGGQDTNNNDSDFRRTSQSLETQDKKAKTADSFGQVRKVDIQNAGTYNRDLVPNLDNRHLQLFSEPLMNNAKQDPAQFSRRRQEQKRRADMKRSEFEDDKGYHSTNDPYMDQISSEMYEQIIHNHFIQRACWVPSRYKKFPRFTIFTSNKDQLKKAYQADQFISLNPQVLALLAGLEAEEGLQPSTILEEQVVTNRTLQHSSQQMRANSVSPRRADALMDYEEIQEEKDRIKELTKIMVDSLANQGDANALIQSATPLSSHQPPYKDEQKKEDESSKGLTLHDEFTQNSPLLLDNMERKGKLGQAPPGKGIGAQSKDNSRTLNTLQDSKQPINDYTQQPAPALSNQRDVGPAKKPAHRLIGESRMAVDVSKNPDNSDISYLDAEKSLLVQQFDPFDKVLLTKGMDNQILTSFRTLEKSNNMISNTLKVIHQRFLAKELNKGQKIRIPRSKLLYPISQDFLQQYAQELLLDQELQKMSAEDRQQLVDNLQKLRLIDQQTSEEEVQKGRDSVFIPAGGRASVSIQRQSMDSSDLNTHLGPQHKKDPTDKHKIDSQKSIRLQMNAKVTRSGGLGAMETEKTVRRNKNADSTQEGVQATQDSPKINPALSTTMSKMKKLEQQKRQFPVSKYDIATGQVVRPANVDKAVRSTSPKDRSLLALTNEATKAALGQQLHHQPEELQVASWRMNLFNMDPNYAKSKNDNLRNSQSPAFKPKIGKRGTYNESNSHSKKESYIYSQDSKNPNGLVDPGTNTKREQHVDGSDGPAEKDVKKLDNNLNLNNESIIGASMLATANYTRQQAGLSDGRPTLNISHQRTNKISVDGFKERSVQRNVQLGTKEGPVGRTQQLPQNRSATSNHLATEVSVHDPTQNQATTVLENDYTEQTQDKRHDHGASRPALADNLDIVLAQQDTFASGRAEAEAAEASQALSRESKPQSRSGAEAAPSSHRRSTLQDASHRKYGNLDVKEVNVGATIKLPAFDAAGKSKAPESPWLQTASARNQDTAGGSHRSGKDFQAAPSRLTLSVQNDKASVNEAGGDEEATAAPRTIIRPENIYVTDGHAYRMITPKKPNPKFTGGFGNQAKLRSHLASALESERPASGTASKEKGSALQGWNTQLSQLNAYTQEFLNNAINQTGSGHLTEIQQALLLMAQAQQNSMAKEASGDQGQQHGILNAKSPQLGEKEKRTQIRQIIDEIYQKDNRYMRKPKERSTLLNTNDIIFDLSRAAHLNNLVQPGQKEELLELKALGQRAIPARPPNAASNPGHQTRGMGAARVTFINKTALEEQSDRFGPAQNATSGLQSNPELDPAYVKGSKIDEGGVDAAGPHPSTFPSTLRKIPMTKSRHSDDEEESQRLNATSKP